MERKPGTSPITRLAPIVFVLLWATGFIGAKYGTSSAEPFTFLSVRFWLTFAILAVVVPIWIRPGPVDRGQFLHSIISGGMLHGLYLGGIFYAIDRGMPAGISSLVVSLQPFFTAFVAWFLLGERLSLARAVCFLGALAGIYFVLFPHGGISTGLSGINAETLTAGFLGTVAISIGAVYQKRYVSSLNLWVSTAGQFIGAALVVSFLALLMEEGQIEWTAEVVLSMAWLIVVLSIGAVALLMYLIRLGDTSSVASLFFLVPVVAMLMAWVLFGEIISAIQILGSLLVVACVGTAHRFR